MHKNLHIFTVYNLTSLDKCTYSCWRQTNFINFLKDQAFLFYQISILFFKFHHYLYSLLVSVLLGLNLFCSSFSSFLRNLSYDLRSFLISNVNTEGYKLSSQHWIHCIYIFWYVTFLLSYDFYIFNISFETFSSTHALFRGVLFSSDMLRNFPVVFMVWISIWSKNPLYMISVLFNLFRFVLQPRIWSVLMHVS